MFPKRVTLVKNELVFNLRKKEHYSKVALCCPVSKTFHNGHLSPKVEKLYDSFSVKVFIFCHIIDAYL